MDIGEKEALGAGAALLGWLGGVWAVARKTGKIEENVNSTLKDHEEKLAEHTTSIAEIRREHRDALDGIKSFFSTAAGGQKFMTFPDHDAICARNTSAVAGEIRHLTTAIQGLTVQSTETAKQVSQMRTEVEVIKSEIKRKQPNEDK